MKKCCVFGLGYIGLPTAAILANSEFKVRGIDINKKIIKNLEIGKIHILEKGLDILVKDCICKKNLIVSLEPSPADIFIIAVPTPFHKNEKNGIKQPNLDYVFKAAKSISKFIKRENLVILESTSPVGTSSKVAKIISENSNLNEEEINVAYCPERVLPGNIIYELINNDRVIGGLTEKASEMAKNLYETFCKGKLLITNAKTAELIKLTENSFRDVNLAFANELSMICSQYNINTKELITLANFHPRVNILNPGCGVGGHCIAVDPWFLIYDLPKHTELIKKARELNNEKTLWVLKQIKEKVSKIEKNLNYKINIGCLGITFKQDVDDTRESPAYLIVKRLLDENYNVLPCEPNINSQIDIKLYDLKETLKKSDLIVILVPHKEFRNLNLKNNIFLDFTNTF
tara:strand:+ start:495 stop:1703 length:1209 start_codon:yes stop_codon:yes gene_type:complete